MFILQKESMVYRQWLILLFCLLIANISYGQANGNGKIETQVRSVDMFTNLVMELPGDVEIVCQSLPRIEIIADENLLNLITTEVWGNELRIKSKQEIHPTQRIKIKIGTAFLQKLVTALGGDNYRVSNIETSSFELRNITAQVILEGKVEDFKLTMESGNLYADQFSAQNVHAQIWGGGTALVRVNNSLEGVINQNSRFIYLGKPPKVRAEVKNNAQVLSVADFPVETLLNSKEAVSRGLKEVFKFEVPASEHHPQIEDPNKDKQEQSILYYTIILHNNSEEKIDVLVQGPPQRPFGYGVPFKPGQKRTEEFPVGTRISLIKSYWFNELLLTIGKEDANKTLPLFKSKDH